jgi:hypothetical protein
VTAIQRIETAESPREVLAADFPSLGFLPIRGGWGYTKADACIIDKDDPSVDRDLPFYGVGVEYAFVGKRIYEELIIRRPPTEWFSGIQWQLISQALVVDEDRSYDRLRFAVTAIPEPDWIALKAEWEGPNGHGSPNFDEEAHQRKREACTVHMEREYWFDITSFFGQG